MKRFFHDMGKGKGVLNGAFRDESDGVMCQIEVEIIVFHRSITLMCFSLKIP